MHRVVPGWQRYSRRHRWRLRTLSVLLLAGVPFTAWGGEGGAPRFETWYQELRHLAQHGPFGVPLRVQSEERNDQVTAEVVGIIEHPFEAVKTALSTPASLCEFVLLNVIVKACTHQNQAHETLLTPYIGRRHYQSPQDASAQPYQFAVHTGAPGFLSLALNAQKGLFGTTAHRVELEIAGIEGRTVVALHSSYVQGAASKLATAIYLATAGRDKVGFSRQDTGPDVPPGYVKGIRGMVERNAMRYYLGLQAFLDTQAVPVAERFEARLNAAYDLMEHYPLQLHDLEKAEYLDAKRRERENQLRLQQTLGTNGLRLGGH